MWTSDVNAHTRSLLISFVAATSCLGVIDITFGRYARTHFVPNMTLRKAEASADHCLVTLGDSRMVAGIDEAALGNALTAAGSPVCVRQLAIGALPVSGEAMALRRFIADGHEPAVVVLGASAGSLLAADAPDPSAFFGNRAAELAWSKPSDVSTYYSRFPFGDFDDGIRFSLARTNSLATYQSLVWVKVQTLQDRLVGVDSNGPRNRFGSMGDMRALLEVFRAEALSALTRQDGHWQLTPWFELIRRLAHEAQARLVVLEVPMPSSYRREILDSAPGRRYRQWLKGELENNGDELVDISASKSIGDVDFGDGIHLDADAARRFSTELGLVLAEGMAAK